MNEQQWATERRAAQYMASRLSELGVPRTKAGRRKLRLLATECCRMFWDTIPDERLKKCVEVAEQFIDGRADKETLAKAYRRAHRLEMARTFPNATTPELVAVTLAINTCYSGAFDAAFSLTCYPDIALGATSQEAEARLCDLLRCVFGNPFRKPTFPKAWRTEDVSALAAAIYDQRAFDRLPVLADALEEAGCDDPAMLTHLRVPGPHCRGCWVLDIALGL